MEREGKAQWAFSTHQAPQILALQELQDQIRCSVVQTRIEDMHDMRALHGTGGLGFALEARQELG